MRQTFSSSLSSSSCFLIKANFYSCFSSSCFSAPSPFSAFFRKYRFKHEDLARGSLAKVIKLLVDKFLGSLQRHIYLAVTFEERNCYVASFCCCFSSFLFCILSVLKREGDRKKEFKVKNNNINKKGRFEHHINHDNNITMTRVFSRYAA